MLTLRKSQLIAAAECAATKDVRYYLVGVHLECTSSGDIHIVSTDGSMLFAGRIPASDVNWTDTPQRGPWRFTIPLDTVKRECRGKGDLVTLTALSDGKYQLGSTVFAPIDGVFPDWRRVLPRNTVECEHLLQVNPDLVLSACMAIRQWHGSDKNAPLASYVEHVVDPGIVVHSNGVVRVIGATPDAVAIVMPLRVDRRTLTPVKPFTPAAYQDPA